MKKIIYPTHLKTAIPDFLEAQGQSGSSNILNQKSLGSWGIYIIAYFLVFCTISCIPITANQPQSSPKAFLFPFNETRIGIGFSGEYLNMEAKLNVQPAPELLDIGTTQSQTGKTFQGVPCIEFGKLFKNNYYCGALLSWHYPSLKSKAKSTIEGIQYFEHDYILRHYTDIFLKVGYKFIPQTMVYGLIGPSIARWMQQSTHLKNNQVIVNQFKTDKTTIGLGLGIGVEYFFHRNYAFSIDYTCHLHHATSQSQFMSYETQPLPGFVDIYSGHINRKVSLSYTAIAMRLTVFF